MSLYPVNTQSIQLTLPGEPVEDILPYRWITLEEQKEWCNFLDRLGIDTERLGWCASSWEKYKCSVNHSHSRKVQYIPCGKRGLCPRCSMSYASKRAAIAYKWVKDNLADHLDFDLKLNQIVLTLPEPLQNMNQKLFSKMLRDFMALWGIDSYGYSIQTRHSEDPLAEPFVHCHILSLNMKESENGMIQSDYYFDVSVMRYLWKELIREYTDLEIDGDVNLHTEYHSVRNEKSQVLHMFSYLYRYPIQDLFKVQVRSETLNYIYETQIENLNELQAKVNELINEKKPRIVWCGMLTSTKRKELIKKMLCTTIQDTIDGIPNTILQLDDRFKPSFEWKSMRQIEREIDLRSKECRDCGSPYELYPFDSGSYDGNNEPKVYGK